jgi:hypothetical protein
LTVLEVSFMIRDSNKGARFVLERKRRWRRTLVKLVSVCRARNRYG